MSWQYVQSIPVVYNIMLLVVCSHTGFSWCWGCCERSKRKETGWQTSACGISQWYAVHPVHYTVFSVLRVYTYAVFVYVCSSVYIGRRVGGGGGDRGSDRGGDRRGGDSRGCFTCGMLLCHTYMHSLHTHSYRTEFILYTHDIYSVRLHKFVDSVLMVCVRVHVLVHVQVVPITLLVTAKTKARYDNAFYIHCICSYCTHSALSTSISIC